jgi:hypothetical protein
VSRARARLQGAILSGLLLAHAGACSADASVAEQVRPPDCHAVVGTYVTTVTDVEGIFSSRELLTFLSNGVFLMTDSGESGVPGTERPSQPAQGAWRCVAADGTQLKVTATALSFVLPSDGRLRTFGRIDYRATIDTGDGGISGSFEVSLPKDDDLESARPIDRPGPPLERFELEGKRMVAQEPSFG